MDIKNYRVSPAFETEHFWECRGIYKLGLFYLPPLLLLGVRWRAMAFVR